MIKNNEKAYSFLCATRVIMMKKIKSNLIRSNRALLAHAFSNKGTAFSEEERDSLKLKGLLPYHIESLDEQCHRFLMNFEALPTSLLKYSYLKTLQDTHEILFYALIKRYFNELLPYIYTPTISEACEKFSLLFNKPRGLFLDWPHRDQLKDILDQVENTPEVIIVTDGERILGMGDLGVNGLPICIGKLAIYTALGGFDPATTLPIVLDLGTNNTHLLDDPHYLGWKHKRIAESDYSAFWIEFLNIIKQKWPNVLLHFEDLRIEHAIALLEKNSRSLCCFNDDFQGTAAIVSACLLAALKRLGQSLTDIKVFIVGAGTAGCGIADQLARLLQKAGVLESDLHQYLYLIDTEGLLMQDMPHLSTIQKRFAQPVSAIYPQDNAGQPMTTEAVIDQVKPNVLIGVTGAANLFSESMIKCVAKHHEKPIIFPLSNPTSSIEATPEDLLKWTNYQAFVSTGSPFDDVKYREHTFPISQCNNIYIFPALGLAVKMIQASHITTNMFDCAAYALAELSPEGCDNQTGLLPSLDAIFDAIRSIALVIAKTGIDDGVAQYPGSKASLNQRMEDIFWEPRY